MRLVLFLAELAMTILSGKPAEVIGAFTRAMINRELVPCVILTKRNAPGMVIAAVVLMMILL